ncbi:MAG: flagellar biosynthesis protein FlhA [Pseudomonadota bacterium]
MVPNAQMSGNTLMARIAESLRHGDIALAFGVLGILVVLILPMPSIMLDLLLAVSITFSVMVLLTSLFIEKPLHFSSFPTVLLIATMLRLALNLASTRLILASGHEGTAAAGRMIEAFGGFIMQGNFVIGLIVFSILVIVNFVVITKGSGRIAEVSARFSLDAMPGKQMAIDADLSAGLIDEEEAKTRRRELEAESSFYGAMDGASKFVRGDAVAGLMITFINLVGGLIIGVGQIGISFGQAAQSYTFLTVGDGLVSQIPALIVSTAAGLLVSKAGTTGRTDRALFGQLGAHPRTLVTTSGLLALLAITPGLPMFPFATLAIVSGAVAWKLTRGSTEPIDEPVPEPEIQNGVPEEEIGSSLAMDPLRLELGYGLLSLIGDGGGPKLTDQIKALRRQLAADLGVIMPPVRIQDNIQLPANSYAIKLKEIEAGRGDLRASMLLVMDPRGEKISLPGEDTMEPTFGLPAKWVAETVREEANFRSYTVVDPATVLTTHITEIIKDNLPELLSYAETQKLLDELSKDYQKLVNDLVPAKISVGGIQRVLQALLAERISIRDLPLIVEAVGDVVGNSQNIIVITEYVRSHLARQISNAHTSESGSIPLITLSPTWEQAFSEALVGQGDERQLAMAPSQLQDFMTRLQEVFEQQAVRGELPVLITSPAIRPYVRSIVERFRPSTVVLSQNEIHAKARIRTLGQV